MSKVAISGNASGTGVFTIASPNSNIDRTLTLPDNTGTLVTNVAGSVSQAMLATNVAGNGPAFSAFGNGISVPASTNTAFTSYGSEEFDTANCFDISNGRFTPNVAGYYFFACQVAYDSNGVTGSAVGGSIFKNGSVTQIQSTIGQSLSFPRIAFSGLLYMNGTTDYAVLYAYQNGSGTATGVYSRFQGFLARAA